jgi:hypothetical protein
VEFVQFEMRVTPAPPKITPEEVREAMQRYRDFYALHCTADPRQRREAVAALEQSIGTEPGASACFLDLLGGVGVDFGDLQPITDGIAWLGFVVGLSAAAIGIEDASWAEDTPHSPEELLARTEETS